MRCLPARISAMTVTVAAALLLALPASGGGSAVRESPQARPGFSICGCVPDLNSTALAGWFSLDANGAYGQLNASWVQPAVKGSCPAGGATGEVLFGLGFAALANNATVGQRIGTGIDCTGGRATDFAWYQFAPHPVVRFAMAIRPGDRIFAEASDGWANITGRLGLSLLDRSTGAVRTVARNLAPQPHGIGWFVERPPVSVAPGPLPDFGTVIYRNCWTLYLGSPNSIGQTQNDTAYRMVNRAGTALVANLTQTASATNIGFVRI